MNTEYITMRADQMSRHEKVFTRWINLQLAKASPPSEIKELCAELKDGQVLLTLVEILLGIEVTRKEGKQRIDQLSNIQQAMRHFEKNKVKTLGLIASEIVAGDLRAILRLVWGIIVRFQMNETIQPDPRDYGVDTKLMKWCKERLEGYKEKVRITNFTTHWTDGLAFNAILHSFSPELFDFEEISARDTASRLNHAFNLATTMYGVPKLVDPEDIGKDRPDKNLITLFLSYLYLMETRTTVTIVKTEGEPEVTTKTYQYKTVTTRYETTGETDGGTSELEKDDVVFYDEKTLKEEGGKERVLHIHGFPRDLQIEQRKAFVVSPFRKPSTSSRTSSSTSRDSDTKERQVEVSTSPQSSDVKTYQYTITTTTTTSSVDGSSTVVKETETIDDGTTTSKEEDLTQTTPVKNWQQHDEGEKVLSGQREVVLMKTTDISPKGKAQGGKPVDITSFPRLPPSDGDHVASDAIQTKYTKYRLDESSPSRYKTEIQINLEGSPKYAAGSNSVDYLKKKLDDVDQRLSDLESSLRKSDKDSMDLKATKTALDQHKELAVELESVESGTYDVLEEGKSLINDKSFDKPHEEYFSDRMDDTENRLKRLEDATNKEHQRLFDLYIILLKQHLERMNDWLVRAESRMALDDDIEPVFEDVQKQMTNHQKFQEDLANYSMVNMILDLDLEDPAIDETIRDWVKVLSERWAAVWTWAEEWKEKLQQALIDWDKFREEEQALLSWLASKEQTMDVMRQTDITDENQVKEHLNMLEAVEREMETQGKRLASLHETGEQLIQDADYHNSTAKSIREQLEDFDRCWAEITHAVKGRKKMLEDAKAKLNQMGNIMNEMRAWMDDVEKFNKSLREQTEPEKENIIQEKVELKCEERDRHQLKIDEIAKLEKELSGDIDKTSNKDMKKVTKPFMKRWNDVSNELNRYRNDDYPYISPDDCFLVKCLKKTISTN